MIIKYQNGSCLSWVVKVETRLWSFSTDNFFDISLRFC